MIYLDGATGCFGQQIFPQIFGNKVMEPGPSASRIGRNQQSVERFQFAQHGKTVSRPPNGVRQGSVKLFEHAHF